MAYIKFFNLIVCFQTNHKFIEPFGSNQISMNIKCLKFHFLLFESAYEVLKTLVCHLGPRKVELNDV
jgi:hypothetical protein